MNVYKTNVFGAINVTNAFLPYLREQREGTIIFTGSRSGWRTKFVVCTIPVLSLLFPSRSHVCKGNGM